MKKYRLHFFNDALFPGNSANKLARLSMAESFAKIDQVEKVYFYFVVNKRYFKKDLFREFDFAPEFKEKIVLKPLFVPGMKDSSEQKVSWRGVFFRRVIANKYLLLKRVWFFSIKKFSKEDLIFARGEKSGIACCLVSFWKDLRFSLEIQDFEFRSQGRLKDFFYKKKFQRADFLVTVSNFTKEDWIKNGIREDKIVVFPSGVSLNKFYDVVVKKEKLREKLHLPAEKRIIMYAGKLGSWKGVDTLIEAFNFLKEHPDLVLFIIGGSGEELKKHKKMADNNQLKNVVLLGKKNRQEIPEYLKSADILVLPNTAKQKVSVFHTSPIKLFEYMAAKVPIVASDLPSIRQLVGEEEVVFFRPDDSRDLSDKIKQVSEELSMEDGTILTNRIKKALEKSQEFTWEKRAKKIFNKLGS